MTRISAICSTYNGAVRIPRMIRSLLVQTTPFDELVVVDDCSSEGDVESVVKSMVPDAVVVRHPENRGIYHGVKTALEHATGDYIVKIDDDDELTPGYCAECRRVIGEYDYDYISFPQHRKYPGNDEIMANSLGDRPFDIRKAGSCLPLFFSKPQPWYTTGKCVKSGIWTECVDGSIPYGTVLDDVFFSLKMHALSKSYIHLDGGEGYIYWFGIGYWSGEAKSITLEKFRKVVEMRWLEYHSNRDFLKSHGFDEKWSNMLYSRCDIGTLYDLIQKLPVQDVPAAIRFLSGRFMMFPVPRESVK